MVNVIMHGCNGKMGRVITDLISKDEDVQIVAGIDAYTGIANDYPVFKSIKECDVKADAIIDFAVTAAIDDLLDYAVETKTPVVVCTTGLSAQQLDKVNEASKSVAVLRSANMSLGINTLMKVLKIATDVLADRGFDIEIVEKHHNQKLDSPSGTALLLADTIKDSISEETHYVHGRDGHKKREKNEIGIHAVRGGSIVGDHDVIFACTGEVIELSHKAISRDVFAIGALKACEYMGTINKPGLYNMDDVLGL